MALKKKVKAKPRNRSRAKVMELIPGELKTFEPTKIEDLLGVGTRARLAAFCAAHFDADPTRIITEAVEAFIKADLGRNLGTAGRYENNGI